MDKKSKEDWVTEIPSRSGPNLRNLHCSSLDSQNQNMQNSKNGRNYYTKYTTLRQKCSVCTAYAACRIHGIIELKYRMWIVGTEFQFFLAPLIWALPSATASQRTQLGHPRCHPQSGTTSDQNCKNRGL